MLKSYLSFIFLQLFFYDFYSQDLCIEKNIQIGDEYFELNHLDSALSFYNKAKSCNSISNKIKKVIQVKIDDIRATRIIK